VKVAITHDDLDITRLFRYLLSETGHEVVWTALDGKTALRKAEEKSPDLIIIKISLPDISTPDLIKQIISKKQTTIIVVGKSIKKQAGKVFEAMSAGALDAFSEPSTDDPGSIKDIKQKIKNISLLHDSISSSKKIKALISKMIYHW